MSPERFRLGLVWLRRDLRLDDNAAIFEACVRSDRVCLAFVIDRSLLAQARIGAPLATFFFDALADLRGRLLAAGSDLLILDGEPPEVLHRAARQLHVDALFFNSDYEPHAIERDRRVTAIFKERGLPVHPSVDHVYFGADEVHRADGGPYRMFAPYKRAWLEQRAVARRMPFGSKQALYKKLLERAAMASNAELPQPQNFGLRRFITNTDAGEAAAAARLNDFLDGAVLRYRLDRNVPAIDGTSRLSSHLRAGTIGIRTCVEAAFSLRLHLNGEARAGVDAWISELIWRDFYQMIYKIFPRVATGPFLDAGQKIRWQNDRSSFEAWCEARTGYPFVDAAMRQLNTEGWMHNRLRMIAASFLSKLLLIDWRLGEAYFERHLMDADPAQNNGGWQWAASTGTDAAPYFRIFNPAAQSKQFDAAGAFVKRYIPELGTAAYPDPIVDYGFARARALASYTAAFKGLER